MKNSIFIVDEDPGILLAFKKILANEKFIISTTTHYNDALPRILKEKPQVVIINIEVPGYSGVDLLQRIKKIQPELPVGSMTVYSNTFTEKDARKIGADFYLKKPFEINTLLLKIKQLINWQQMKNVNPVEVENKYE